MEVNDIYKVDDKTLRDSYHLVLFFDIALTHLSFLFVSFFLAIRGDDIMLRERCYESITHSRAALCELLPG